MKVRVASKDTCPRNKAGLFKTDHVGPNVNSLHSNDTRHVYFSATCVSMTFPHLTNDVEISGHVYFRDTSPTGSEGQCCDHEMFILRVPRHLSQSGSPAPTVGRNILLRN